MVVGHSLESFSPASRAGDDASPKLAAAAYEGLLGPSPSATGLGDTPQYAKALAGAAAQAPDNLDASWGQIKQMVDSGKNVQFSALDAQNKSQADYILTKEGKLVPNPDKTTPPSPDGKINIAVEGDPKAAQQAAQALQVAAVQEKISYWQRSHPDDPNVPDFLKGELAAAQNAGTPSVAQDRSDFDKLGFPDVQPPQQPGQQVADNGDTAGATPASYQPGGGGGYGGGGGEGGGGAGGGGGYRGDYHGLDDPGAGPQGGYTPGEFDPDARINPSAIPPPAAGDMSILIDPAKGPSCTADQIQAFLDKAGSPAAKEIDPTNGKSFAQNLYDTCVAHHLDPGAAVGFFLEESSLGTKGRGAHNHSIGNIKGVSPESHQSDGTFRKYNSFSESARDWANLIDNNYVHKRGATTLGQILNIYAPASDGNNVRGYVATVKGVAENFRREKDSTAVA